jgi:hypothetical protein
LKKFLSDFGITSRYIKMSLGFFFRPNRKVTLVYDSLGLMDFLFSFFFFLIKKAGSTLVILFEHDHNSTYLLGVVQEDLSFVRTDF